MFDPVPNLPDETLIEMVRFSPSVLKSLRTAGLKTIGEIRRMSDTDLRLMRHVGVSTLAQLRRNLGVKKSDGLKVKRK
jgi:hypothetical protein